MKVEVIGVNNKSHLSGIMEPEARMKLKRNKRLPQLTSCKCWVMYEYKLEEFLNSYLLYQVIIQFGATVTKEAPLLISSLLFFQGVSENESR